MGIDAAKNREYVARYRAKMKANEDTKKEYNDANLSYFNKHVAKKKETVGTDAYNKKRTDYMKEYRAKQNLINSNASIIQTAIRNIVAKNAVLQLKKRRRMK